MDLAPNAMPASPPGKEPPDRGLLLERPVARVLWILALALSIIAVILAVLAAGRDVNPRDRAATSTEVPIPGAVINLDDLERKPVDSLPSQVSAYEAITLQEVPSIPQAAEAVYVSFSVKTATHHPVRSYARVEAFSSSGTARAALDELISRYPAARRTEMLSGITVVEVGFTSDSGARIAAWTRGQFLVYVKTFFDRTTPVIEPQQILEAESVYLVSAVEMFQRTGLEGPKALAELRDKQGLVLPGADENTQLAPSVSGQ